MRSSQRPIVATWVLTRFGNGNEVLAGDLVEEYQRGRTAAWYWRQVLVAILVGCGHEIRTQKLLTMRAVITGWAALILYGHLIGLPLYKLYSRVLMALGLGPLRFWWWHYYTYPHNLGAVCRWFSQRLACSSLPSNTSGHDGDRVRGVCAADKPSRDF
jgi:hypothetical protein